MDWGETLTGVIIVIVLLGIYVLGLVSGYSTYEEALLDDIEHYNAITIKDDCYKVERKEING